MAVAPYTNTGEGDSPYVAIPNADYAAPGLEVDAPYNDYPGWGPKLTVQGVSGTPDAHRLETVPTRDFHPVDEATFFRNRDAEKAKRYSVEDQDADGWEEQKSRKAVGRNPRETPPPETRPTERMSPRSYSFMRPFDQQHKGNGARQFNGVHFSMADHRRNYDANLMGMQPVTTRRNTYRIEPGPWDAGIVDVPPEVDPGEVYNARMPIVDVPMNRNRSGRLD